jgi:hypothetical protein
MKTLAKFVFGPPSCTFGWFVDYTSCVSHRGTHIWVDTSIFCLPAAQPTLCQLVFCSIGHVVFLVQTCSIRLARKLKGVLIFALFRKREWVFHAGNLSKYSFLWPVGVCFITSWSWLCVQLHKGLWWWDSGTLLNVFLWICFHFLFVSCMFCL